MMRAEQTQFENRKIFQKKFEKPLDKIPNPRYNKYVKRTRTVPKTRKETTMKKNTMIAVANYIKNVPELANEYAEIAAELAKGEAKAQANRELYATAHDVVMAHLTNKPQTVADLFTACEAELPEGFSKSKMQYALGNYWAEEVVKTQGKVNEYTKA